MIEAPQVDDRVLVSSLTEPPILATVESIVGFQSRNDEDEWVVNLNVDCQAGSGSVMASCPDYQGHVVLRRWNTDIAKWALVDSARPQPASKYDSRLEEASNLAAQLVDVVRWALGENGEFVEPPEYLTEVIVSGRAHMKRRGVAGPPLYWWRGELRRRAKEAGAAL